MYILKCSNDKYYTGSTKDLGLRIAQHQVGEGNDCSSDSGPAGGPFVPQVQGRDHEAG